jgi:hypothetical protein
MPATDPPSYSSLFAGIPPGLRMELKVQPREDEGKEKLPSYTNDIFLKAVMPRRWNSALLVFKPKIGNGDGCCVCWMELL